MLETRPDLVSLDIRMPLKQGMSVRRSSTIILGIPLQLKLSYVNKYHCHCVHSDNRCSYLDCHVISLSRREPSIKRENTDFDEE